MSRPCIYLLDTKQHSSIPSYWRCTPVLYRTPPIPAHVVPQPLTPSLSERDIPVSHESNYCGCGIGTQLLLRSARTVTSQMSKLQLAASEHFQTSDGTHKSQHQQRSMPFRLHVYAAYLKHVPVFEPDKSPIPRYILHRPVSIQGRSLTNKRFNAFNNVQPSVLRLLRIAHKNNVNLNSNHSITPCTLG